MLDAFQRMFRKLPDYPNRSDTIKVLGLHYVYWVRNQDSAYPDIWLESPYGERLRLATFSEKYARGLRYLRAHQANMRA